MMMGLDSVVMNMEFLKPEGKTALKRLLWCTTLLRPEIQYCPLLPNLFCILLIWFTEAETMMMVDKLFDEMDEDSSNPRLVFNVDMHNVQAQQFLQLARNAPGVSQVIAHLEKLQVDVPTQVVMMLRDGLAHQLPLRALVRVYGSFLTEGAEVITRYALALMKTNQQVILKTTTKQAAVDLLMKIKENLAHPTMLDEL